jgi:hypothetical protein
MVENLGNREEFVVFPDRVFEGTENVQEIKLNPDNELKISDSFEFNFSTNTRDTYLLKQNKTAAGSYLVINNSRDQSQMPYELFQIASRLCKIYQTAIFNLHGSNNSVSTLHIQIINRIPIPTPKDKILTIKNEKEINNLKTNLTSIREKYGIISNIRILSNELNTNKSLQIIIDFRHPYFLSEGFDFEKILSFEGLSELNIAYKQYPENQDLLDIIKTTPHSGPDCFTNFIHEEDNYLQLLFEIWGSEEVGEKKQDLNQRRIKKLKYIFELPSQINSYQEVIEYIKDNPVCMLYLKNKINNFVSQSLAKKLNLLEECES